MKAMKKKHLSKTLPSNMKKIVSSMFSGCESLLEITIPERVTEIGENAFKNCGGLQTLFVPKKCKLKKVGVSVFKIRRY